jgi:hypothetical protein
MGKLFWEFMGEVTPGKYRAMYQTTKLLSKNCCISSACAVKLRVQLARLLASPGFSSGHFCTHNSLATRESSLWQQTVD